MNANDLTGEIGEYIFMMHILLAREDAFPYFQPVFLGAKNESLDFLVRLLGVETHTPYFFVQVKSTRLGYTRGKTASRLQVGVSGEDIERIKFYSAPTYLVGVDVPKARSYIVAIDDAMIAGISSISTAYSLKKHSIRKQLRDEVRDHWAGIDARMHVSRFRNQEGC
jgi:hypothetical protein